MSEIVALIPARSGSKRIAGKNLRELNGAPLIAYTISAALESDIFDQVIVSTNDIDTAEVSTKYGAHVPGLRPNDFATDSSPDIDWVMHALNFWLQKSPPTYIAILRPTSPLRQAQTIIDAFNRLKENSWADSLRAMERVSQHPGKMWKLDARKKGTPLLPQIIGEIPTHSLPTQSLTEVWVQNASLEIASVGSIVSTHSISGSNVMAYEMPGREGFDINLPDDWLLLENLVLRNPVLLPSIPEIRGDYFG